MTAPSDREVFLNEVREAIETEMQRQDAYRTGDLRNMGYFTELIAQAAVDAMVRRLGPEF